MRHSLPWVPLPLLLNTATFNTLYTLSVFKVFPLTPSAPSIRFHAGKQIIRGNGDTSYAQNSSFVQRKMLLAIKPTLEDAIEKNTMRCIALRRNAYDDNIFRIADLGCATGTNTLLAADAIVKAVERTCIRHSIEAPEFQIYFADLPSNDFNSLLRMLSLYDHARGHDTALLREQNAEDPEPVPLSRGYFASAVAGSFHKRLFPRNSLNFVHSSLAVHWLSNVPESIQDQSSDAWNGGHIFISSKAVGEAYLRQFSKDLTAFLRCRADEVLPEGGMFLAFPCRNSSDVLQQDGLGVMTDLLEAAFHDLVAEGLIEKEVVDSFNLTFFSASAEEFRSIAETENSFYVERLQVLSGFPLHPVPGMSQGQEHLSGKKVANYYRAIFENMVGAHLGSDILVDRLFCRIEERATARCHEYLQHQFHLIVAFLVRRS